MDSLHTVLRSIKSENRSRRDHLTVFREFLDHLDRAARRRDGDRQQRAPKTKARTRKR